MSAPRALLREGYARAKGVTRHHAKSFYFASHLLFGARRRAAFALYAFCRGLDDLVDEPEKATSLAGSLDQRLARARRHVSALYVRLPELRWKGHSVQTEPGSSAQNLWHPAEFAALEDTIQRFRIPEEPFQELISGMEMDLAHVPFTSFAQLELYCYRVAGVVGLMLAPVLGCRTEDALPAAADLGIAMQLTNILRDVQEDLERGRCYLPADELAAFQLSTEDLRRGVVDDRWRAYLRCQIARARAYYARAARGIPALGGFGTQRMVRLMGAIYGDILRAIEQLDYDVFHTRAHVDTSRKLELARATFFRPRSVLPAPRDEVVVPLLPTGTLP